MNNDRITITIQWAIIAGLKLVAPQLLALDWLIDTQRKRLERQRHTRVHDHVMAEIRRHRTAAASMTCGEDVEGCPAGACDHPADAHGAIFNQLCDVEGCPCGQSATADARARSARAGGQGWVEAPNSPRKQG